MDVSAISRIHQNLLFHLLTWKTRVNFQPKVHFLVSPPFYLLSLYFTVFRVELVREDCLPVLQRYYIFHLHPTDVSILLSHYTSFRLPCVPQSYDLCR